MLTRGTSREVVGGAIQARGTFSLCKEAAVVEHCYPRVESIVSDLHLDYYFLRAGSWRTVALLHSGILSFINLHRELGFTGSSTYEVNLFFYFADRSSIPT